MSPRFRLWIGKSWKMENERGGFILHFVILQDRLCMVGRGYIVGTHSVSPRLMCFNVAWASIARPYGYTMCR